MAEGLAKSILGPGHNIESAGSHPGKLNPFAVQAMQEIDIDISKNFSKSINDLSPRFIVGLEYVIYSLCRGSMPNNGFPSEETSMAFN